MVGWVSASRSVWLYVCVQGGMSVNVYGMT